MRSFMDVLHQEYDRRNRIGVLTNVPEEHPARTDVAVAAYLDTTDFDFDAILQDDVTIVILGDLGPSADFVFGTATRIYDRASEQDVMTHEVHRDMSEGKAKQVVHQIVSANMPVLVLARDVKDLGAQIPKMAARVLFARVDQALVDDVAEIFWSGGERTVVREWVPNLTDVLVALRGAKLREHFYANIVLKADGPEASPEPILGPLFGVIIADYFLVKQQSVRVEDLYSMKPEGAYFYNGGWNRNAVLALGLSAILSIGLSLLGAYGVIFNVGDWGWLIGATAGSADLSPYLARRHSAKCSGGRVAVEPQATGGSLCSLPEAIPQRQLTTMLPRRSRVIA